MRKTIVCALSLWVIAVGYAESKVVTKATDKHPEAEQMPSVIEQFTADSRALDRTYPVAISPARIARFEKFYNDTRSALAAIEFDTLSHEDQIDYLLLKSRMNREMHGQETIFTSGGSGSDGAARPYCSL
jgi:hypothetical protein